MAKKKKKNKKKGYHRKNPKRVAAGKKAYAKMKRQGRGIAKKGKSYSKKKGRSYNKKKNRKSPKKRKSYARKSAAGFSGLAAKVYSKMIAKGRSPQQAHNVAARVERMRSNKAKKFFANQSIQAKSAEAVNNLWANIATAGHLAHSGGVGRS